MSVTDLYYLTIPFDDGNQASSFASYLHRHGYNAEAENNEVTCPLVGDPAPGTVDIHQLHRTWSRYWDNYDSDIFSLPVFVKAGCGGQS